MMLVKILSGKCKKFLGSNFNCNITRYLFVLLFVFFHRARNLYESHYEVLKLKRNCTNREIRNAYIKLSKEYHPDTSKSITSQKFVKVVEAYNVLSKPDLRRSYDSGLRAHEPHNYYNYNDRKAEYDPIFWNNRDKTQDKYYEGKPYYGIKGINRVSNSIVVIVCLMFCAIGVGLQVLAIRKSVTLKRELIFEKSQMIENTLAEMNEEATRHGNTVIVQRLIERFEEQNLISKSVVNGMTDGR